MKTYVNQTQTKKTGKLVTVQFLRTDDKFTEKGEDFIRYDLFHKEAHKTQQSKDQVEYDAARKVKSK